MSIPTKERRTLGGAAPLLAATAASVTGDGAFDAAVPLLAATLTHDPLTLSTVTAAAMLPRLLFSLHAGALTDRWPRRRTMLAANLLSAAAVAALALLQLAGHPTIAVLALVVAAVGTTQCFYSAASQSVIPALVGRDEDTLKHVNGRYWSIDTAARQFAGPSLGSITFAVSRFIPFTIDAASFLLSAALLRRLPENTPTRHTKTTVGADIREGLHFIGRHPQLRAMVWITLGNNSAFTMGFAVFVLYARHNLHVPTAWYGALLAATAVGGIATGWWIRPLTKRLANRTTLAVGCALQGIAWAGIAATSSPYIAAAMFLLIGAAANLSTIAVITLRQTLTPDHLLGRVTSVFRLAGSGITALAALAGGALGTAYGIRAPFIAAVLILAAVTAAAALHRTPRNPGSDVHAAL